MVELSVYDLIFVEQVIGLVGWDGILFFDVSWIYFGGFQFRIDWVIFGLILFNIDVIVDSMLSLLYILFLLVDFEQMVGVLGISNFIGLIVYDCMGVFIVLCVWWMFKIMGYDNIVVFNGGMFVWLVVGGEIVEILLWLVVLVWFKVLFNVDMLVSFEQVRQVVDVQDYCIFDVCSL